jgi:tRNA U34 5-methylaminomethyl-2-thiouridine-forming methyltransferase MnmC
LHQSSWEKEIIIYENFTLCKSTIDLLQLDPSNFRPFHLIYFDAFGPGTQPELWTKEIFEKLSQLLLPGGLLVTYCSKSDVRRNLQAAGFLVEKISGPLGKREMVRARKSQIRNKE